ncbi:MAG TPA: hypothetical protein VGM88_13030 [Kofleriaceae bacterium]|jgi:hypothetical protein
MFDADADKTPGKKAGDADVTAKTPGKSTQIDHHPGGTDALGKKENKVAPFFEAMEKMSAQLAPQFAPLGMKFRPEIILATVLQEASDKDPVHGISFDNGLGLMQITPYQGKLDPDLAKILKWDNAKSVSYNIEHSSWRDGATNIEAGSHELLDKAKAVRAGVPSIWSEMDDHHKWRATMFAYNAGQGSAIHALKAGGPNGAMISSFKNAQGQTISHDYTKELDGKLDYVDKHDPFKGGKPETGGAQAPAPSPSPSPEKKPEAKGKEPYTEAPTIAQVEAGNGVIKIGMKGESVKKFKRRSARRPTASSARSRRAR